jgi:hypothetical protein
MGLGDDCLRHRHTVSAYDVVTQVRSRWPVHRLVGHDCTLHIRHAYSIGLADCLPMCCHCTHARKQILAATGGSMRLTHYRFVEYLLACLELTWGAWLIVFDSYDKSPVLAILKTWGVPEWVLILWPVLCGVCIIALPADWRRPAHLTAFPFWIFVAVAIFQRDIALTAIPVYAAIGILHAGNFLLSRGE